MRTSIPSQGRRVVEGKRKKDVENREKADRLNARLDQVQPVLDLVELEGWYNDKKVTVKVIDAQLQWQRRENPKGVRMSGNRAQKINALIAAVKAFHMQKRGLKEPTEGLNVPDSFEYDSDCEDLEEELMHD
ncbi:hypothetical protein K474DRAFT_1710180 [Panus rudis PR-1116 ss-1]|nr:hypothetical protein K474DRAFT_1710180 [Panus rudis PR-1116 ss-1]